MAEQLLQVNGVELCVEAFGNPADPPVLLLAGMSSSMDAWDAELCERLAVGRYVLRFDYRDTGRSTTYPPGEPGYTGADLRDDVIALLDALTIDRAHLVGVSMGGGIAQCVALEHPGRVATLTLISTTSALDNPATDLPPPAPELTAFFEDAGRRPEPDWTDRQAVVDMLVSDERAFLRGDIDDQRLRSAYDRMGARARNLPSFVNHGQLAPGREPEGTLADIAAPTLVIHGTADPLFPLAHGEALAREIPDAALLALEGAGHQMPQPATWDVVVPALLRHTSGDGPRPH